MASWDTLVDYVRRNYKVADESDGGLKLVFDLGDLRSQAVYLWRQRLNNGREEWVQIESPFAAIGTVDLEAVIRRAGSTVCGAIASYGETLTFRHSVPLENLDINEFERPLGLVTQTADSMERELTGSDRF